MNYIFSAVLNFSSIQPFWSCLVHFTFFSSFLLAPLIILPMGRLFSTEQETDLFLHIFTQVWSYQHSGATCACIVLHFEIMYFFIPYNSELEFENNIFFFQMYCMALPKNSSQFPNKSWFRMYGCRGRMRKGKFTNNTGIFYYCPFRTRYSHFFWINSHTCAECWLVMCLQNEKTYSTTVVFTCSALIMSQKLSSFWYTANV